MHVAEFMSSNKFRKIKLKSFFKLSGVITVWIIISLKQYFKIVDIVGIKSFYTSLLITILTLNFSTYIILWIFVTGPVLKNLIEKFDLQRIFLELAELDFLLLQVCSQWQNDATR